MKKHESAEGCGCAEQRHHGQEGGHCGCERPRDSHGPSCTCGCHENEPCTCGCHSPKHQGGCTCSCHDHDEQACHCGGRHVFRRRFITREERIARLQAYLDALRQEAQAVEEHIAAIRAEA